MKDLAIVAIPSVDDPVWRYSSEEIPHLTLLYLGEQPDSLNTTRMEEFIEHVVNSSMCRFGMSVDSRGTLGDKNADVLFFDKTYCPTMLTNSRSYFLADPDIKRAYDSTKQYSTWVPHLTMGYPETPAKPDERDYPGFHWVNFDRIAFWTGDYEGPEYKLKSDSYSYGTASMSGDSDRELSHYGVKGMHWGRRNSPQTTPQERLKQIEKKKMKYDGQKIVDGAGLVGWAINKGAKNPSRRAIRSVATRGVLEVATILGGGSVALNHVKLSPKAKRGAQISGIILAGKVGQMRINQIRSVRQFTSHEKLINEEVKIKKDLRKSAARKGVTP